VPTHELRKKCPGCEECIHALCGRVLLEDEGSFKEDDVLCPNCDNRKQPARHDTSKQPVRCDGKKQPARKPLPNT